MAKPKWQDAVREQREGPAPEPEEKEQHGRCKCGSSEFKLSVKEVKGKLTRTCECGDKVHF